MVTGYLKRDQHPSFAARPAWVGSAWDRKRRTQQAGAGETSLPTRGCSSDTLHRSPHLRIPYIPVTTGHLTPAVGSAPGRLLTAARSTAYPTCWKKGMGNSAMFNRNGVTWGSGAPFRTALLLWSHETPTQVTFFSALESVLQRYE